VDKKVEIRAKAPGGDITQRELDILVRDFTQGFEGELAFREGDIFVFSVPKTRADDARFYLATVKFTLDT